MMKKMNLLKLGTVCCFFGGAVLFAVAVCAMAGLLQDDSLPAAMTSLGATVSSLGAVNLQELKTRNAEKH